MNGEDREVPLARRPGDVDVKFARAEPETRRRRRQRSRDDSKPKARSRSGTPSKSPPIKVWDPVQAENDKIVKKKEREELYHSQNPNEEPILLIKKREIITKYIKPESEPATDDGLTKIIKKSDRAKYVDVDYDTAKRKQEEMARQDLIETKYIEEQPGFKIEEGKDYTTERTIKIEGTEYLPKGFIELDPMLYKDEYLFTSVHDEKNFEEDQRRTKEMRRQQYNNRNFAKVREVIIYKIEYLKRRATQILEKWFQANNHGMDQAEILKHSQELQVDPDTFQKMHDVFREDRTLFGKQTEELNKIIYKDNQNQETRHRQPRKKPEPSTPTSSRREKSARKVEKPSSPVVSKSEVIQSISAKNDKGTHPVKYTESTVAPISSSFNVDSSTDENLRNKEGDAWKRAIVALKKEKEAERKEQEAEAKAQEARNLKAMNDNEDLRIRLAEEYRIAQEEAQIYRKLRQQAQDEASKAEQARREAEKLRDQAEFEARLLKESTLTDVEKKKLAEEYSKLEEAQSYQTEPRDSYFEGMKSDESKELWKQYESEPVPATNTVYLRQAEQDRSENESTHHVIADQDGSHIYSSGSAHKHSAKSSESRENIKKQSKVSQVEKNGSSDRFKTTFGKEQGMLTDSGASAKAAADESKAKDSLQAVASLLKKEEKSRRLAEDRRQSSTKEDVSSTKQTDIIKQTDSSLRTSQASPASIQKDSRLYKAIKIVADSKVSHDNGAKSTQNAQEIHATVSKDKIIATSKLNDVKHDESSTKSGVRNELRTSEAQSQKDATNNRVVSNNSESHTSKSKVQETNNKQADKATTQSSLRDSQVQKSSAQNTQATQAKQMSSGSKEDITKEGSNSKKVVASTVEESKSRTQNQSSQQKDHLRKSQTVTDDKTRQSSTEQLSQVRRSQEAMEKLKESNKQISEVKYADSKQLRQSDVSSSRKQDESSEIQGQSVLKEGTKRRDNQTRKQETRESQTKVDESVRDSGVKQYSSVQSGTNERRRVSDRGINKLIEKKLEEAQHSKKDSEWRVEESERSERQESRRGEEERGGLRESKDSSKMKSARQDKADSGASEERSVKRSEEEGVCVEEEEESETVRARSSAFRVDKEVEGSDKPGEQMYTQREVEELLRTRQSEWEAGRREELEELRAKTVEEVIQKKDSVREVCRDQLWERFLLFCEQDLPKDVEFQRHLMNQTFLYFLDKHLHGDQSYFADIEDRCNQLIREDRGGEGH